METERILPIGQTKPASGFLFCISHADRPILSVGEFITVGRDSANGLVVADSFVSSKHARIERKTGGYVIRDLHSRNGTYLNGSRINEAIIANQDHIRFGETVFMFTEESLTKAALTSKNETWAGQLARIPAFSATEFPVLIFGPSGSGKEVLARAIHDSSLRSRGPLVGINCSALSESLIESELFGHVRGSFTGATHDRKGAFESARGGTLFLDEIGDLPLTLQPKLLRALENSEIRPVGSDRTIQTDVRVIAATHKNLCAQIRQSRFREDLFYRLNVCQLQPPPLKARMEDFDDLVYQFAKQYRVRFSFAALEKLKAHSWPGNIRELKNLVARTSAYFPGKHILPDDILNVLDPTPASAKHFSNAELSEVTTQFSGSSVIREIEREMIVKRLEANHGNQRQTAKDLGMAKSTLHDRIRTYMIDVKQIGRPAIQETRV